MTDQEITLRIILVKPPAGVDFALQSGSGNNFSKVQKQRSGASDLSFEFLIRVKITDNGQVNFLGQYAQGPPAERFVYIDIGTVAGQFDSVWSRRLKVPLKTISADEVREVLANPDLLLETRVPGTAKDGGPNCATVKPFAGWGLKKT